jgi:hypothetical protein
VAHPSPSLPGDGPDRTWRRQSRPSPGGASGAVGHVTSPEPFPTG